MGFGEMFSHFEHAMRYFWRGAYAPTSVGDRYNYNPNPLRDGMHDWVEANNRVATLLKAKGYHHQYVFRLNAGHTDRNVRALTLTEALECLWRWFPTK